MHASHKSPSILLLAAIAGCGIGEGANSAIRSDSAGVEIVVSPGIDRPLVSTSEPVVTLGGEDEGPESFYVVGRLTAGADAAGNIYVLRLPDNEIVVFGAEGRFLRAMGSTGGGPGEIEHAGSLAVADDGTVSVFDWGKMALVRFGPDGETLAQLPFQYPAAPNRQRHFAPVGGAFAVSTMDLDVVDGRALILRAIEHDSAITRVDLPSGQMVIYEQCGGGLNLPALFSPEIVWDARGDVIAYSSGPAYVVNVVRDGRVIRSVRRDIQPREATHELAIRELGEGYRINFGRGPCVIRPEEMVEKRGFAPWVPAIRSVALAPDGSLWVERPEPGRQPGPIDVFDATGAYTGTLPDSTPFPVLFLPDGRIGVVEADADDVERLAIYRVQW